MGGKSHNASKDVDYPNMWGMSIHAGVSNVLGFIYHVLRETGRLLYRVWFLLYGPLIGALIGGYYLGIVGSIAGVLLGIATSLIVMFMCIIIGGMYYTRRRKHGT